MTAKNDFIKAYFEQLEADLGRAQKLLAEPDHYLDSILLLSCHIGSFAAMRYPELRDDEAYKKVVLEYSGMNEFYEQIDLLFFCQWSRSEYKDHGTYKKLNKYDEILAALRTQYGDDETIKANPNNRYVSPATLIGDIEKKPFEGYDGANIREYLPLFSNVEILYKYVRCQAVHSQQFPLVNIVNVFGDGLRYKDNHVITGNILNETASNILSNLKDECLAKYKWPHEL